MEVRPHLRKELLRDQERLASINERSQKEEGKRSWKTNSGVENTEHHSERKKSNMKVHQFRNEQYPSIFKEVSQTRWDSNVFLMCQFS